LNNTPAGHAPGGQETRMKNPFDFIARLPQAELSGEVVKSEGVMISGAWSGQHALVNILYGDNVPVNTYTIGITGRGTLQMPEQEFRDLLSSMLAMFEARTLGFTGDLTPVSKAATLDLSSLTGVAPQKG
jgi:hypothetical protein